MKSNRIFQAYTRRLAAIMAAFLCALSLAGNLRASDQTIQLVADNDFAVFAGTSAGITRLLYQNYAGWPDQIEAASSFTISLAGAEDTIYVLAMGGGGEQENISGQINGVNIATLYLQDSANVLASSNVASYLSNYNVDGNVEDASYTVELSEVQNAFAELSWSAPTINETQNVILLNPYSDGIGFAFPTENAILYQISAEVLNIPEPAAAVFLAALSLVFAVGARRRKTA